MVERLVRLVGVITVLTLWAPSAVSAADEIGLSRDGLTWTSSLSEPLFDPAFRWVPGDSQTASFYVRNQGPSGALLTVEARSADTGQLLEDDHLVLQARVAGETWVRLDNGVASRSLTARSIARDDVVQVDVNATFDPFSTNQSQTTSLALAFTVTLRDSLDGAGDDGPDDGSGLLPMTGAGATAWMIAIGTILVLLGVLAARRREEAIDRG